MTEGKQEPEFKSQNENETRGISFIFWIMAPCF
jgi:hypothetical protein